MAGPLSGNLATFTWTASGSAAAGSDRIQVAEAFRWTKQIQYEYEDTTPVATNYPRVSTNTRRPVIVDLDVFLTDDAAGGFMAMSGVSGTLVLQANNADSTHSKETLTAYCVGVVWQGQSNEGARKMIQRLRFVSTGSIATINGNATTVTW